MTLHLAEFANFVKNKLILERNILRYLSKETGSYHSPSVASSEEVTDLSDAVAESQTALDELLANSSVYQNSIIINSVATLDVYQKMGSSI